MIFVGVDISKYKHHCCIINELGEVVQSEFSFENTREGFAQFLSTVKQYGEEEKRIGFESTGHYACNLVQFLDKSGLSYCDDVHRILRQEHSYSINMSHKKAPTNMSKLTRIEQHAPTIRDFYFRDSGCRDEDYRKAMNELTSFSFTAKNLHDDAADSMAMLAAYVFDRSKVATVARRPF